MLLRCMLKFNGLVCGIEDVSQYNISKENCYMSTAMG